MKNKPKPIQTDLFKEEVDDSLPFVFDEEDYRIIELLKQQENDNKKTPIVGYSLESLFRPKA